VLVVCVVHLGDVISWWRWRGWGQAWLQSPVGVDRIGLGYRRKCWQMGQNDVYQLQDSYGERGLDPELPYISLFYINKPPNLIG
jgi:hypothetical protein